MKAGDLSQRVELLYNQLSSLGETINSSLNHKDRSDFSYPQAAKGYNFILRQLREMVKDIDYIRESISQFTEYEEKDFLRHGNYKYASKLLVDINMLTGSISQFKDSVDVTTKNIWREKPLVFISYAGEELALADFIRDVVIRLAEGSIEAFVAKRGIPAGANPLKTMMEVKLKNADAVIPICSIKSKESGWVWWESAAVWARGKKVYPLFTNILASDFGAPLTLVSQGKDYFVRSELIETVRMVCADVGVKIVNNDLTAEEWDEHEKLKSEYSKPETSVKVLVDFIELPRTQDLHKYSFVFEAENRSQKRFDDVDVELYFPADYLEEKKWDYFHLKSSTSRDKPGYLCLTFSFSGLPEKAKKQFTSSLLPGKKLKVFGESGMTKLHYYMDGDRWEKRFKYDVHWKVYINGGAPQEGSIPLNSIQAF